MGSNAIGNRIKRTQNTFLYSVKASIFKGFQREATFYFPNWYYGMPMAVYSFLEEYDFSGKTIIPFVTSGGSGFSDAISEIQSIQSDATVLSEGYKVTHSKVSDVTFEDVEEWINGLNK